MILTRSMATINNVQEDEQQPAALKKQVQVLTAAVERLTRQNQVLEKQLHRKAGNNIAEDLEDSSAERRDSEGPEGSNAPSGLERQNVSIPSLVCRAFPTTLKGAARIWFNRLTPNSVSTFKELSAQFIAHFIGGHRYKKSTACLMSIK